MTGLDNSLREELLTLSREIHADPEIAYEEHRAADRICALLEKHGHKVERPLGGLATAFRARIGPPKGPSVALLAEYDALPDIGHACGHNLIAMTNVGAFLALAADPKGLEIGVELIGTPAEEKGGGKIDLLDAGVFKETVAALSSHGSGSPEWETTTVSLGIVAKRVAYKGVAAHAAFSPDLGKNALNGVIRLFVGVDGWRQHMPKDSRIHGVITNGGGPANNIIPAFAECTFGIRAKTIGELDGMVKTFEDIAKGAAMQTGTEVKITDEMRLYAPTKPHPRLGEILREELAKQGARAVPDALVLASTDFGNVSQAVPSDYVGFPVATKRIGGHNIEMRESSVTDYAHKNAFITTLALAATARRVASENALRSELRAG